MDDLGRGLVRDAVRPHAAGVELGEDVGRVAEQGDLRLLAMFIVAMALSSLRTRRLELLIRRAAAVAG